MYFCKKCNKKVLDKEVHTLGKVKLHIKEEMGNSYTAYGKYQPPGKVGFDPITIRSCYGNVREATEEDV